MLVSINHGSGPLSRHSYKNALANIEQFVKDTGSDATITHHPEHDENGRYFFALEYGRGLSYEVEMPGCPLDAVRYMKEEGQNIWDFPRLYLDGASWIWVFALDIVKRELVEGIEVD